MLVVSSGSEEDRVVSVPAEGPVTSSVGSVVHVVGAGGGRSTVGVTAGALRVCPGGHDVKDGAGGASLKTVLLLDLSGLPRKAGHSVHGDGLTREVGEINVLDRDDEIAGGGGHGGHNHGEGE